MNDVLYLASRYLSHNRGKAAVLVGSIGLILFLPAGLHVVVGQATALLTERAERTPLLLGAQGSPVELTLASLYFTEPALEPVPMSEVEDVRATGLARALPLHLRFTASGHRIVGTVPEYLDLRELRIEEGRRFAVLGEAVLGAEAAEALGVGVGGSVLSAPAGAFDVAGGTPLRMEVVGILERTRTPDDRAIFVDVRTAWVIQGIGHGHEDVTELTGDGEVLERDAGAIVAGPEVLPYTEITRETLASFHFHGDPATFPVDAAILVPADARSEAILRGRYLEEGGTAQVVAPVAVVDDLVDTMFSVRDAVILVALGLGAATAATCALVFALSVRLRRREIDTMRKIGASGGRVRTVLATEVLGVLLAAVVVAGLLTLAVSRVGDPVLRLVTG